jgi:hypothetical protein
MRELGRFREEFLEHRMKCARGDQQKISSATSNEAFRLNCCHVGTFNRMMKLCNSTLQDEGCTGQPRRENAPLASSGELSNAQSFLDIFRTLVNDI